MGTSSEDEKILDKIKLHTTVQQEMNEAVALINMYDPKGELWGNPERNKEFCKRLEEAMQRKLDAQLAADGIVYLNDLYRECRDAILGNGFDGYFDPFYTGPSKRLEFDWEQD